MLWLGLALVASPAAGQDAPAVSLAFEPQNQRPPSPEPDSSTRKKLQRWIDWQVGNVETRYRYVETSAGVTTSNQQQHKETFRVGLTFDPDGRYSLQSGAATGGSITSGWDNLGLGRGDPTWDLSLRQLFLAASPTEGLDGQVGGLYFHRGEQTEITSYDNDVYLMGARVSVKRPAQFYLDEVSVTVGHFGDFNLPNVFRRFRQIDNHNFTQVLVGKKFGSAVAASAEWASHEGVSTLRQAARIATKEWLPLDAIRFEQYQRVEGLTGYGFAVAAERAITRRLTLNGGFARIDQDHPPLNGDRYLRGRRLFGEAKYALLAPLTLAVFYTQAFKDDFPIPNEHRFEIVVSYNLLKGLQAAGAW